MMESPKMVKHPNHLYLVTMLIPKTFQEEADAAEVIECMVTTTESVGEIFQCR